MPVTEGVTGKHYLLRSPLWVAPGRRAMVPAANGVIWAWRGKRWG